MRKILRRYGKQVMVFVCTLVIFAGSVFSFSFTSDAADSGYEFYKNYAEPSTSDTQGYFTLFWKNSGGYNVSTFFWNCYAETDGATSPVYAYITLTSSTITFTIGGSSSTDSASYSLYHINEADKYLTVRTQSTSSYSTDWSTWGITLLGWHAKGNVGSVTSSFTNCDFEVYYSTDGSAQLLMDIISLLTSSNSIDSSILTAVTGILNSVDGVESQLSSVISYLSSVSGKLTSIQSELENIYDKADELLAEEQKQTSWLEKIWNSIQEFLTKEPAEDAAPSVDEEDDLGSIEESEEILLPDTSDAEASLQVELNSGFGVLSWLVESFAKLDAGVFAMYLSMLTFGVIALLLGR